MMRMLPFGGAIRKKKFGRSSARGWSLSRIDFAVTGSILTRKRGSHWLRVRCGNGGIGDPLNLMRVMPP